VCYCQYFTVQQLKESEKNLKVISILHVVLASRGKVSLRVFLVRPSRLTMQVMQMMAEVLLTYCLLLSCVMTLLCRKQKHTFWYLSLVI